jgi:hypothetical protein
MQWLILSFFRVWLVDDLGYRRIGVLLERNSSHPFHPDGIVAHRMLVARDQANRRVSVGVMTRAPSTKSTTSNTETGFKKKLSISVDAFTVCKIICCLDRAWGDSSIGVWVLIFKVF